MDIILLLIRIFLFAVFAVAGIGKLLDLQGSEKAVKDFGAPPDLAKTLAIALPFAEIVFAVCLLFVGTSWLGAVGALILLLTFIGGMIMQMAQGNAPDCHCFGQIHSEPVGVKSLIRNVVIAVLALVLVAQGWNNQGLGFGELPNDIAAQLFTGLAAVALLGAAVFYLKTISEQQTQIMRRIEVIELISHDSGKQVEREEAENPHEGLPIGAPFPDFELADINGKIVTFEHLLGKSKPVLFFFVSPNCAPCKALLPEFESWQNELQDKIQFVYVSSGKPEENLEKLSGEGFKQILLQKDRELADEVKARWTPTALLVNADGAIASHPAVGDAGIRALIEMIKRENFNDDLLFVTNGTPTKIGESVPEFSLADLRGKQITAADFQGRRTLVAFWSMTCPFCVSMMEDLRDWDAARNSDEPELIVFSTGDAEAHEELNLKSPILLDDEFKTAEKFGMSGTPSAVLVDEKGRIVSETAVGANNIWALIGKRK
ncbi:MAG: redoxin domain-containing protein [Acidobacteriota bacterium]|nr:redoxin domain-containing protein [Acidobacteriota bacterium]